MSVSDAGQSAKGSGSKETYTFQRTASATGGMAARRAQTHAAFFTPHLRSGMRLLDCGCGPGSITCDLAEIVAPAEVIGIDADPKQTEAAIAYAAEQGTANVRFQAANIYELPFPDGSFDAVFAHAILDHLSDPLKAVKEMRRVLRPGGVMGARSPDFAGIIIAPPHSAMTEFFDLYERLLLRNGGSPHVGKHLRAMFHKAGCVRIEASASYECHGTIESVRDASSAIIGALLGPNGLLVTSGLVDPEQAARLAAGLNAWGEDPGAFLARPWCEAVGWVE